MSEFPVNVDRVLDLAEAIFDNSASENELVELDTILLTDHISRGRYLDYCRMQVALRLELRSHRATQKVHQQIDIESAVSAKIDSNIMMGEAPSTMPGNSPPLGFLGSAYHGTVGFFSQELPLSLLIATVIMGMMLLGAWAYKITHHQHIAEAPSQSVPSDVRQEMVFVGRITGMVDVKWSDDPRYLPPLGYAHVPLDRKYILSSGLLEITYDSGAKVILQGPCIYEVESTAGGYLALGKLTARVGAVEGKGSRSKVQGSRSKAEPSSFILHPSSLFSVRTPTAVVTDLGTEFAVEVDKSGVTESHVFRGKVEVRLSGDKAGARAIQLGANKSARVESGADRIVVVSREAAAPGAFTRRMPQWVRIELFNTGVELKEGDEDPRWQLVARSDDPDFQPRQAVVTAAHVNWQSNYAVRSQWISTANGPPNVPNVTYTFRTTFELANALPETAVLRGRFLADNHVQAIRLNGKEVPAPEHGYDQLSWFSEISEFSATKGFVEGANTLEIDVLNGRPSEAGGNGPMGLRVELGGYVFSREKGG